MQETLLAAIQGRAHFAGHSPARSWLVSILKHKVIDFFRKQGREAPAGDEDRQNRELERPFDDMGNWNR